ncbi:MAG: hypothetical protein HOV97_05910 [Nonomuraea sp.]|nr:hypothetical protein [Nonomuraea sp.]
MSAAVTFVGHARDENVGPLRWHYGPTDTDPDPGKMWCYTCGGEVFVFKDGAASCAGCGAHDEPPQRADERLLAIAALVDEATGYSVPYKRSRFMPIDSAFTDALKEALGVKPAHSCVATLEVER